MNKERKEIKDAQAERVSQLNLVATETRYTKTLLALKSNIKRIIAKSTVTSMDRKAKGFAAFKLNSARMAMEAEFRARVMAAGVARAKEAFSLQINRNRRSM